MKIIRAKDYNDMSRKAANIISAQVILKPDSVLGLATGSSPVGTYDQLVKWYHKGDVDFPRSRPSTWTNTTAWRRTTSRATTISCIRTSSTM